MIPVSRLELILKSERPLTKEQRQAILYYLAKLREMAKYQKSEYCNPLM